MATKPKPVPWPDVLDLRDELFEWLVKKKLAKANQSPLSASCNVLATHAAVDGLPRTVAEALFELEALRAASRRADREVPRRPPEISEEDWQLFVDDAVERDTERTIREFPPRIDRLEQRVGQMVQRKMARVQLLNLAPHVVRGAASEAEEFHDVASALIDTIKRATVLLYDLVVAFSPCVRHEPLTLSGWRAIERGIRARLKAARFVFEDD